MVLIFNSTVSREISRINFTHVRLSGKWHLALPGEIVLVSERSERDTIRGVQIRAGAVYIHLYHVD